MMNPENAHVKEFLRNILFKGKLKMKTEEIRKKTVDQLNNFIDTIASTNSINPTSNDQKDVEYDQNGFDLSEPFFNKDTGTAYNLEGFDKNGYNSAGFNKSGLNNATNYNSSYDENVSPS